MMNDDRRGINVCQWRGETLKGSVVTRLKALCASIAGIGKRGFPGSTKRETFYSNFFNIYFKTS